VTFPLPQTCFQLYEEGEGTRIVKHVSIINTNEVQFFRTIVDPTIFLCVCVWGGGARNSTMFKSLFANILKTIHMINTKFCAFRVPTYDIRAYFCKRYRVRNLFLP